MKNKKNVYNPKTFTKLPNIFMNTTNIIEKLKTNWKAWLTVAMINIPLSISLAVASWASPTQWIITWIWATLIAAIFASSNYNVFWVAWALTSIILAFVLTHWAAWVSLLPIVAIISWIIILLVYILKITKYITLIPSAVLHWFLISVGITIALSQIYWALWLNDPILNIPVHKEIYLNLLEVFNNINLINIYSFLVFFTWLWFLIILKKKYPNFPAVIILTIVWIILWMLIEKQILNFDILLLSEKFPNLSFKLFEFPFTYLEINSLKEGIELVKSVFTTSLVIAIIAILETIISARIAEKMVWEKFNKDKEVLWLSLSNIFVWLLWWIPVTAVFIRTSLNIKSWANHKTAQALTWIFTLIIAALLFNWFFKYLPFPIIAAILFNIALWLIDLSPLKKMFKLEKSAFYIMILTIIISVLEDATYWILIWTTIALIIFVKRVSAGDAYVSVFRNKDFLKKMSLDEYSLIQEKNDIVVVNFIGWLSYLNIEPLLESISKINLGQTLLISFSHMWSLDVDSIEWLEEIVKILKENKVELYFSWITEKSKSIIEKNNFYKELEEKNRIKTSTSFALKELLWK